MVQYDRQLTLFCKRFISPCSLSCLNQLVSSANRKVLLKSTRTASGGSFMYMMNKRGSKILPCVTPNSTGSRQELCS